MPDIIEHEDDDDNLPMPTPDVGMLVSMHAKELDIAIVTAKRFPRSIGRFDREVALAIADEDAAQECIYVLPRGGKAIEGPSIRFAEIIASAWGNSEFASRIAEEGETSITAQAVFKDLEKNNRFAFEVPRRITDKNGNRFNQDMILVTANAAMSVALRNAILKGIPKAYWGPYYAKCKAMIAGTFETLDKRRATALEQFKKLGVSEALVLALLKRDSVRDIEPEDMVVLRGTLVAIKDGDTSVNRVFGALDAELASTSAGKKADVSAHLANGKKAAAEATSSAKPGGKKKPAEAKSKPATEKPTETAQDAPSGQEGSSAGSEASDASGGAGSGESPEDSGEATFPAGEEGEVQADSEEDEAGATEEEEAAPDLSPYAAVLEQKWAPASLTLLTQAATAFAQCSSAAEVAQVYKRRGPEFESETPPVENAFAQIHRIASKRFAGVSNL